MKTVLNFLIGLIVAHIGIVCADLSLHVFDFLPKYEYGTRLIWAYGIYLCNVVVTCTCIIVSKIKELKSDE